MSGGWNGRQVLSDLGVAAVINAHNDLTGLGGSLPRGPVLAAMAAANESFVEVESLSDAAGVAIARMLGVEAALVTPGAAAGAVLAAAACITAGKDDLVARIPDTSGLAREFVVPADRRTFYDRCLEGAGGKIVPAGEAGSTSAADLERCISERTAGIFFYAPGAPGGMSFEQILAIAGRHDLPLIVDAAEQVYPLENLSRYVRAGADFATYSGKFFGAGSMAGILTGTAAGISAARRNSYLAFEGPDARAFGRHMKVGRSEIVAAYAALRHWLETDHEERYRRYRRLMDSMAARLAGFSFLGSLLRGRIGDRRAEAAGLPAGYLRPFPLAQDSGRGGGRVARRRSAHHPPAPLPVGRPRPGPSRHQGLHPGGRPGEDNRRAAGRNPGRMSRT